MIIHIKSREIVSVIVRDSLKFLFDFGVQISDAFPLPAQQLRRCSRHILPNNVSMLWIEILKEKNVRKVDFKHLYERRELDSTQTIIFSLDGIVT